MEAFPTDAYLDAAVRFLDVMRYNDDNYTAQERARTLHYVYQSTAKHFARPAQQQLIKVEPKRLQAWVQSIVALVVSAWPHLELEAMVDLGIYYTYTVLLDDTDDEPSSMMWTWYEDLVTGQPQRHTWWQMVNKQLPDLLRHYGPYCKLNIVRSNIDFFQGCWIENRKFQGHPGAYGYPDMLRRLNGLGQHVGASLFPKSFCDEESIFAEITTALTLVEDWEKWVNDLFSFFKEFDAERDQVSLINNYAKCDEMTTEDALGKLVRQLISNTEQLVSVFEDKDPIIREMLNRFCQGYVTWHLTSPRYRLCEIAATVANSDNPTSVQFCRYQAAANHVGNLDSKEWAYPPVVELAQLTQPQEE